MDGRHCLPHIIDEFTSILLCIHPVRVARAKFKRYVVETFKWLQNRALTQDVYLRIAISPHNIFGVIYSNNPKTCHHNEEFRRNRNLKYELNG